METNERRSRKGRESARPENLVVDLRLPCHPKAPSMARQALRQEDSLSGPRFDLLELLVTEVITNAVLHSGGDAGSSVHMVISLDGGKARAVVADKGPGFTPQVPERDVWSTSRRGLLFLDELADEWGTTNDGGHAVWFEIDLDA